MVEENEYARLFPSLTTMATTHSAAFLESRNHVIGSAGF
jgi:hypothetical protein